MAEQSLPIEPDQASQPAAWERKVAQEIADATGLGAKYIADQLTDAEAWETAAELLQMGAVDEIRELIDPRFKAV
jgi:ATP-dependent protease ClpP protease subunit